jgi:hypothetical protein
LHDIISTDCSPNTIELIIQKNPESIDFTELTLKKLMEIDEKMVEVFPTKSLFTFDKNRLQLLQNFVPKISSGSGQWTGGRGNVIFDFNFEKFFQNSF